MLIRSSLLVEKNGCIPKGVLSLITVPGKEDSGREETALQASRLLLDREISVNNQKLTGKLTSSKWRNARLTSPRSVDRVRNFHDYRIQGRQIRASNQNRYPVSPRHSARGREQKSTGGCHEVTHLPPPRGFRQGKSGWRRVLEVGLESDGEADGEANLL